MTHWKIELIYKAYVGGYSFGTKKAMNRFYKIWENKPGAVITKLGKV